MVDLAERQNKAHPDGLAALLDAVVALGSDLDLNSVLRRITETSCALTGAKYGFLAVVDNDGAILDFVTHGMSPSVIAHVRQLPQATGLLGVITHTEKPVRLTEVSDHPMAAGFPAHHPMMHTFLGVPVRIRGTVFGNLYLTEKRGGEPFTAADESLVEALAGAAGYVIDNARAYSLSELRRKWLEASAAVSDRLQAGDIDAGLCLLVQGARDACGGSLAALLAPVVDGPPDLIAMDGADDAGLPGWLERWSDEVNDADFSNGMVVRADGLQGTVAFVPMRALMSRRGVLVIRIPQGRGSLEPGAADMFTGFADQASLALDRAQALADRQELLLVAERERIARDLHDVVIQRIFATGLQLQGMRRQVANPVVEERLEAAVADLDDTIRDIRTSIFDLQEKRSGSLRSALADLVVDYEPILRFSPRIRTSGPIDSLVPDDIAQQLLSVLREALSNVARHAGATTCDIRVVTEEDRVTLVVDDDGVGVPEPRSESGLRNARVRASDLGGTMLLSNRDGGGTRLRWRVPLVRVS